MSGRGQQRYAVAWQLDIWNVTIVMGPGEEGRGEEGRGREGSPPPGPMIAALMAAIGVGQCLKGEYSRPCDPVAEHSLDRGCKDKNSLFKLVVSSPNHTPTGR